MNRSTAQRLGDVTLILAAFAVVTMVGRLIAASDLGDDAKGFWSYVGLTAPSALLPAFAAACTSCWMDADRRPIARAALVALFAVAALGVLGDVVFGGGSSFGGGRSANFIQDAASLLMVAGGITLIAGLAPAHDG